MEKYNQEQQQVPQGVIFLPVRPYDLGGIKRIAFRHGGVSTIEPTAISGHVELENALYQHDDFCVRYDGDPERFGGSRYRQGTPEEHH